MRRFGLPGSALATLLAIALAGAAAAAGNTAKSRLADARSLAAKWQPDAVLVTVSALQAKDHGTAAAGLSGWIYQFHSPKANKWVSVYTGKKGLERDDLPVGLKTPLPQDFVDSDKALDAARKGEILPYLERLRDESGVPMVYVSHQADEVRRIAGTVVRLDDGKVTAVGGTELVG